MPSIHDTYKRQEPNMPVQTQQQTKPDEPLERTDALIDHILTETANIFIGEMDTKPLPKPVWEALSLLEDAAKDAHNKLRKARAAVAQVEG